jgi:hypothetical protein
MEQQLQPSRPVRVAPDSDVEEPPRKRFKSAPSPQPSTPETSPLEALKMLRNTSSRRLPGRPLGVRPRLLRMSSGQTISREGKRCNAKSLKDSLESHTAVVYVWWCGGWWAKKSSTFGFLTFGGHLGQVEWIALAEKRGVSFFFLFQHANVTVQIGLGFEYIQFSCIIKSGKKVASTIPQTVVEWHDVMLFETGVPPCR